MESRVLPHKRLCVILGEEAQHQLPRLHLNGQEYQSQTPVFLRASGPKLRSLGRSGTLQGGLHVAQDPWLSETVWKSGLELGLQISLANRDLGRVDSFLAVDCALWQTIQEHRPSPPCF